MASKSKPLTEAEIVKMPKSEYMNAAQLRVFRERLLARPTATLTIEAQERRELKQKLYGE